MSAIHATLKAMQADRLLALLLLLQANGRLSAASLARQLEVSTRTIYRDLDALSAAGVPVYAERGRNGGCRLMPGFRTDMTGMTADEARALFVFAGRGLPGGLGHEPELKSALRKLLAAVPEAHRPAAVQARERVVVDPTGWSRDAESVPHLATVQEAVWLDRRLRVVYRSSDAPRARELIVEPYGLVAKAGIWYLIAAEGGEPRLFRASRIEAAELLDTPASRPLGLDLEALWLELRRRFDERGGEGLAVRALIRTANLARFLRMAAAPTIEPPEPGTDDTKGGWTEVGLRFRGEGPAVAFLLGFGGEVEALEPASIRLTMGEAARAIVAHYGDAAKTSARGLTKTER
jgi:predicted DNA-binding transcriptional regulator YafY